MELSEELMMLAYADDIIVLEKTREDNFKMTEKLLKASMSTGLCVNDSKTKYMVMSRNNLNVNQT